MPVPVPRDFPFPSRSGIASGKPVRAGQIAQVGHAINYIKGHGHTVIPAMSLASVPIPPGTTYTYDVEAPLKPWTRHVVWSFRPRINTAGGFASGTFTGITGATFSFSALRSEPEYRAITTEHRFIEAMTSAPVSYYFGTPSTFSIENDATSTHDVYVDMVQCIALPRETLEVDGVDDGLSVESVGAGLPIFDQAYYSIGGISRAIAAGEDTSTNGYATRALFAWARPQGQGITISGGGWTTIFEGAGPVVQAHHRKRDATAQVAFLNAIGTADAFTLGEARFTAASGASVTDGFGSGTWGFPQLLGLYAEDLSTNDGRRSATDDLITIEARVSSGAGNVYLHGLSIIDSVLMI